jgi:hypothetical protein
MTEPEFKSWLEYHKKRFPGYAEVITKRDLTIWYDITFAALEFDLCKQTSDEMVRGELDHPKTFDLDRLPAVVRTNVHRLMALRRDDQSEFQREQRENKAKRWKPKSEEIASDVAYLALCEYRRNVRSQMMEAWIADGNERRDFEADEAEINRLAHVEATRLFAEGVTPEHEKWLRSVYNQRKDKGLFRSVPA